MKETNEFFPGILILIFYYQLKVDEHLHKNYTLLIFFIRLFFIF